MPLKIEVHRDFDAFDRLETAWHKLHSQSTIQTIFQTPEFLKSWWEVYGQGELQVVTIETEKGELVGLCPFQLIDVRGVKVLTFIGNSDVTDAQDILVHRNHTDLVYKRINEHLSQNVKVFDRLELFSLPENSSTLQQLNIESKTKVIEQQPGFNDKNQQAYLEVCPVIELPKSWEDYLESLDRKQRHEVRRKMRKLTDNLNHRFELVEDISEYPSAIDLFITLHKASADYKNSFWNPERERFFMLLMTRLSEKKWLRLFFLYIEEKPTASMLIFNFENEYQLYNSGFDPSVHHNYSTGQVLISYTIQDAIENHRAKYNFLRGNEDYKLRLGGKPVKIFDLIIS